MRRKNIPLIDRIVREEYADKLKSRGFHPFKDNTEWIRLVDGEIVQTVVFYEYHYWLEVFFSSGLLSEFLWIDYRSHRHIDNVIGTSFCNVRKRYGIDVYTMNDIFGAGSDKMNEKLTELHKHLELALKALDEVKKPADIAKLDTNEQQHPERICLHYAAENGEMLKAALENVAVLDPRVYSEDEPPESPRRDFWRVWRVKMAFVSRSILESGDMNILKDYAEECRQYNIRYLKKRIPEIF